MTTLLSLGLQGVGWGIKLRSTSTHSLATGEGFIILEKERVREWVSH